MCVKITHYIPEDGELFCYWSEYDSTGSRGYL